MIKIGNILKNYNINIYVYLIILTVINWTILKSFKKKIKKELQNNKRHNKTSSNLIYIITLPVVAYITYLIFANINTEKSIGSDNIGTTVKSINKTDTIVTDISSIKDITKTLKYDKPFPLSGD